MKRLAIGFWFLSCLVLAFVAAIQVDNHIQLLLAVFLVSLLLLLRLAPRLGYLRILFLSVCLFLVLRYGVWRVTSTLNYDDFPSFSAAILLFAAELYGMGLFFLSSFVNSRPISRKMPPLPSDQNHWPTVAVLIPTLNEPAELLKVTLTAALALDYPKHKFQVYLLDDGATREKRNSTDPTIANRAWQRYNELFKLCHDLGVKYHTRTQNAQAKAGNLNAILPQIQQDLILVLDSDHVPTVDFLHQTVGFFLEDNKLFLLQTPHFFINPDPLEKNLAFSYQIPSENHMFYEAIQAGLDFWEASFFCGSAAILRMQALRECGGFSGKTVTEDAETALILHSQGWQSKYILTPLISGLQPETFTSFVAQRIRWAQGMLQLLIAKNPITLKGLKPWQRLGYVSNMIFWLFPFARVVFLISPLFFLYFGLKIYDANGEEILSYAIPYLMALVLANHYLFGRVRWFMVSDIYESMQSLFLLPAIFDVLKNPTAPKFKVTPKIEKKQNDAISPLAKPFYALILLNMLAIFLGIYKFNTLPEQRTLVLITLAWAIFNGIIIMTSLGALYERRQRRISPRLPAGDIPAQLIIQDRNVIPVKIRDLSVGGISILIAEASLREISGDIFLKLHHPTEKEPFVIRVIIANQGEIDGFARIGLQFLPSDQEEYKKLVLLVHGSSERWLTLLKNRDRDFGILASLHILVKNGFYHAWFHFKTLLYNRQLLNRADA